MNSRRVYPAARLVMAAVALFALGVMTACAVPDPGYVADAPIAEASCPEGLEPPCYLVTITSRGEPGEVIEATCQVDAVGMGPDYMRLSGADQAVVDQAERGSLTAVPTVADEPTEISIKLPDVEDPSFERWQVSCEPGLEG